MTQIEVRRAKADEAEAIMPLWREMMELHQAIEPARWTMNADAEDTYRTYLAQCLADPEHMIAVAVHGDEVVGYIHVGTVRRPPVIQEQVVGSVNELSIAPAARRQGIGRALVAEAMRWFHAQGLGQAEVGYAVANPLSTPFWTALEFRPFMVRAARRTEPIPSAAAPPAANQTYFGAVADDYDRLQPIIAGPSYDVGRAMVVDLVPHESHDEFTCLDLGCGTGTLIRRVLDRFPKARGIGLDGDPAMMEVARRNLSRYSGRAEVRQGDILGSELPDCDLVLSSFMFHHIPPEKLPGALGRGARALRPGGCFILLDQMTAGPAWRERIGGQNRRLSQRHVAAAVSARRTTHEEIDARWALKRRMKAEGKDVEFRHNAEILTAAMVEAGFDEVGLVWRMFANTILIGFVPEESS